MTEFVCERLAKKHDLADFDCGVEALNRWLRERARQDQDRLASAVFVLCPKGEPNRIAGFYTLAATSIVLASLPASTIKKLARYPIVPATLIGRLARDLRFPGVGSRLLVDALSRSVRHSDEIAATAIVVDAKDENAAAFYRRFGFQQLIDSPNRLFLTMATAQELWKE